MADKYELARQFAAARERRQHDLELIDKVHNRDREIKRLRMFLREIAAPLTIDVLSRGDFREIAQVLTGRIAMAGTALTGAWPEKPAAVPPDDFNPIGFGASPDKAPEVTNGDRGDAA